MSSDITRSEAIKTLKEHLSHWERLLQEHICEEQEGIDTISSLKLAIASLETDEAYQLEYERTTKSETLISLGVYKQVAWERDIAIQQLHELGYEFGQKIETTTKNDLGVDREEAIETLKENLCAMCTYGSQCMESCDIKSCDNRDAIKALEQEPRWIPVSERLPENGQNVLFCDIDNDIMVGYHIKGRPNTHFSQDGTYEDMKNVRAWMPLPEPFEPQESEDKE